MKIMLFKSNSGYWFFHLKSGNGKIMAASEGYSRKKDALRAIFRIRTGMPLTKIEIIE